MTSTKPQTIIILGPTATGKSDLAVELSLHIQKTQNKTCEIISADSRQIYKHLDLGTGKITETEMKGIRHHMLDIIEPNETYSIADYKAAADQCIAEIISRKHIPILVGGTGLYIDHVIYNYSLPEVEPDQQLRDELEAKSHEELLSLFNELNKDQPHHVDLKNKRKLIRAIEILKSLGTIPELVPDEQYNAFMIGLDMTDEALRNKIKARIDKRLEQGMIEESKNLLEHNQLTYEQMRKLGLEYAFIAELLQEKIGMDDFKELLFFAIWHYAKRQRTWFKKNKKIDWNYADENMPYDFEAIFVSVDSFLKE